MNVQQIIAEASKLPLEEQRKLLTTLAANLKQLHVSEEEKREHKALETLLAKGIISRIPPRWNEDEEFEPEEITGEPLSETIIRERR
jgi:hypothetical protein